MSVFFVCVKYRFEHNTNRVYCKWCGEKGFQRVAVYHGDDGKLHYRFFAKDRYQYKYLEKKNLIPKGSQLVPFKTKQQLLKQNQNQRKKQKRGYLGKPEK